MIPSVDRKSAPVVAIWEVTCACDLSSVHCRADALVHRDPSGFLPIAIGKVRQTPLAEIYRDNPFLRARRDPDRLEGKCGSCASRRLARAYVTSGNPFAEDLACAFVPAMERAALWEVTLR